jgi:hypothetical protein
VAALRVRVTSSGLPTLAAIVLLACGQAQPEAHELATPTAAAEDFSQAGWKTDFSKHSVPLGRRPTIVRGVAVEI